MKAAAANARHVIEDQDQRTNGPEGRARPFHRLSGFSIRLFFLART